MVLDGLQIPHSGANHTMRRGMRVVSFGSEPGKADGDAATDRRALRPARVRAEENYVFGAGWLPGNDLRAMQTDLSAALWGGHVYLGNSAVISEDLSQACDCKAAVKVSSRGVILIGHRFCASSRSVRVNLWVAQREP